MNVLININIIGKIDLPGLSFLIPIMRPEVNIKIKNIKT